MSFPAGAVQALSINRYLFSHSGAVIEARANDGGSTVADFSLSAGSFVLTSDGTTSLASWLSGLSATAAFCRTLYDHSGSGNNATQTTESRQPEIKEDGSGALKNYLALDGTADALLLGDLITLGGWSSFWVSQRTGGTAERHELTAFGTAGGVNRWYHGQQNTSLAYFMSIAANGYGTSGTVDTSLHLHSSLGDSAGSSNCVRRLDGTTIITQSNTSTNTPPSQAIGSYTNGTSYFFFYQGNFFELVSYASKLSDANRDTAEADQNGFYVSAGSFQPAWAQGSNTIIMAGVG